MARQSRRSSDEYDPTPQAAALDPNDPTLTPDQRQAAQASADIQADRDARDSGDGPEVGELVLYYGGSHDPGFPGPLAAIIAYVGATKDGVRKMNLAVFDQTGQGHSRQDVRLLRAHEDVPGLTDGWCQYPDEAQDAAQARADRETERAQQREEDARQRDEEAARQRQVA